MKREKLWCAMRGKQEYAKPNNQSLVLENKIYELNCNSISMHEYEELLEVNNLSADTIQRISTKWCGVDSFERFRGLPNLKELIIKEEGITNIQQDSLPPHLVALSIAGCNLSEIHEDAFKSTPNLTRIALADNSLTQLSPKLFRFLEHLEHISLSKNGLTNIEGIFNWLPAVRYINLGLNSIETITLETFVYSWRLETVNLSENPIQ